MTMPYSKYRPYQTVDLPIDLADAVLLERGSGVRPLRHRKQALVGPIDVPAKQRMFDLLVTLG